MRIMLLTLVLLAAPAAGYAHSGTLFKAAASYLPLALAVVPLLRRLIARWTNRALHKREKNKS